MKRANWLALSSALAAFLSFQPIATAQETAPPPAPSGQTAASSKEADSEVIVITAEKRVQNLQTVPLAVSAFSGKDREKLGITSVQDLTNYVPGVAYQTGLDRFYVRGVGRSSNNPGSDGGTAIYVDGVFTESSYAAATPNILQGSTEVLRGPQTTLWGRNAIGGALLINSKRPERVQSEEVRALYGSFGRWEGGVRVTGPLPGTDQIRYAVTADTWKQDEGYYHNVAGGKDEGQNGYNSLFDAQIEADLTPNLNVWLRARTDWYDYSNRVSVSNAPYQTALIPSGSLSPSATWALTSGQALNVVTAGPLVSQNPAFSSTASDFIGDLRAFSSDTWGHQTLKDNYDVASQVSWDLGGTNLKYIGGAQHYYYELISDFDATNVTRFTIPVTTTVPTNPITNPLGLTNNPTCTLPATTAFQCVTLDGTSVSHYIEDRSWYTHEINWSSSTDSPLQWLLGAFYYHETEDNPVFFPTTGFLNTKVVAPTGGPANPSGIIYSTDGQIESTSSSAFGQLDWKPIEQLKFTAGLRYTHDHKIGNEATRQIFYGPATTIQAFGTLAPASDITPTFYPGLVGADGFARRRLEDTWNATTGSLGMQWTPAENTMFYARYDRGYKAGAFNLGTIVAAPQVGAEHLNAYEVGAKARPLDSLQTNLAVFYYDWQDRQTPVTYLAGTPVLCPGATNCTQFINLPKSTSKGLELETNWTPFTDAHIRFTYSYLDSKVDEACCFVDTAAPVTPLVAQDVAGNDLPNSPRNRYLIGGDYTFRPSWGSIYVGANYSWRAHSYTEFFNTDFRRTPSYGVLNLTTTWTDPSGRFSIDGHVNNALDDTAYEGVFASSKMSGTLGDPGFVYTPELDPGQRKTFSTYGLAAPRLWSIELRAKF